VQRRTREEIGERVGRVLELVELTGFERRAPNQLSGGQQQRVALARALVMEPKVLLLDEPLSNLDAKLREQMRTEIRRIQQKLGITSVYVTHDQIEAMTLSDHIVVMNGGRIEQAGTPEGIYLRPRSRFVAGFIGRANFVPGTVREVGGEWAEVDCLSLRVRVGQPPEAVRAGQAVSLVLRPEMLWIAEGDGGGRLEGLVRRALYLGDAVEYDVEVQGQLLTFTETNPLRMKVHPPGSRVPLDFHAEMVHLLPEG
jgi:iron(III) transport system ATP-binding protein